MQKNHRTTHNFPSSLVLGFPAKPFVFQLDGLGVFQKMPYRTREAVCGRLDDATLALEPPGGPTLATDLTGEPVCSRHREGSILLTAMLRTRHVAASSASASGARTSSCSFRNQ